MDFQTLKLRLTGTCPLILHNGHLADPTNEYVRQMKPLVKKRNKTDADYEDLKKLEWLGGLYTDEKGRISVPADMVLGAVIGGARKSKRGKQAEAAILCPEEDRFFPLLFDGQKQDRDSLYASGKHCDYRSVVIGKARTMRARPFFDAWSLIVKFKVDCTVINLDEVVSAMEAAGHVVGMGDYRPRYGRFSVERVN